MEELSVYKVHLHVWVNGKCDSNVYETIKARSSVQARLFALKVVEKKMTNSEAFVIDVQKE